jgi:hypothetical protein
MVTLNIRQRGLSCPGGRREENHLIVPVGRWHGGWEDGALSRHTSKVELTAFCGVSADNDKKTVT